MFKKKLKKRMRKHLALPLAMLLFLSASTASYNSSVKALETEDAGYVAEEALLEEVEETSTLTDAVEERKDDISFVEDSGNDAATEFTFTTVIQGDNYEKITPLEMLYDDRIDLSDYEATAADVQISSQQVTSKKLGTNDADDAVLVVADGQLVAVGTGTATVKIKDEIYEVTVTAAPISMLLVTGHSLGEGLYGNGTDSVLCDDGWAYDTRRTTTLTSDMGIGYGASKRPDGIDALVSSGAGVQGNDSALAYEWKKLTGEKLWVINTSVGGSNLLSWSPGTVYSSNYNNTVTLFQNAETIMKNEVAAGHYILKHMGVVNHCSENGDETKNPTEYDKQFDAMWRGFKSDFAMDIDGDGKTETVDCIALAPVWKMYADRSADATPIENPYVFTSGRLANYYMAYFENDGVILSTNIGRQWLTDDAVAKFFQEHPVSSYFTKSHGASLPGSPTAMKNYKEGTTQYYGITVDGIHYCQLGYNIVGLEIMDSMYKYWYGTNQATSARLLLADGKTVVTGTLSEPYKLDESESLYLVPDTNLGAKLNFEASGSITYEYPCQVRAVSTGQGTLKINSENGVTLCTVVFQVGDGSTQPPQHVCGNGTFVKAVNATCTTAGSKSYYTCSCGKYYEDEACTVCISNIDTWKVVAALGHNMIAATCTEAAHCARCTYTEGTEAGHDFTGGYDGYDADSHWHICNRTGCDAIDEAVAHFGGTATTDKPAVCSGCGRYYGDTLKTPIVTAPTVNEEVVYNPDKTLADYTLSGTDAVCNGQTIKGTWSWKDMTIVPEVCITKYKVVFTPDDLTKYVPVEKEIVINVKKATPKFTKLPSAGAITYGQSVGEAEIIGGIASVAGTKLWTVTDSVLMPTVAEAAARTYRIEFRPVDAVNYETIYVDVNVTVNKAAQAPNMPSATMNPAYSVDCVGELALTANWSWADKDVNATLVAGKPYVATAVYTGADAGNYEIETVNITISRSLCNHTPELRGEKKPTCTETGYSGDIYCSTCEELIVRGEKLETTPHQGGRANCKQGKICTVCKTEYGDCDPTVHIEKEVRNKVAASCTRDGYSGDTYCVACNSLIAQGVVDKKATGHNYKGVVTKEPTYDEEGITTYTCIICEDSYTEEIAKRPVDVPFCKESVLTRGWDEIALYVSQVRTGEVVTIDMNGDITVPAEILRVIYGKDVAVKFEMSDGTSWTIGGKYITDIPEKDVDLRIWTNGNNIPVDAILEIAGDRPYRQMHFVTDGALGFETTINVSFDATTEGLYANVFKYNVKTGKLEYMNSEQVAANGMVAISLDEAVDYVIILADTSMEPAKDEPSKDEPSKDEPSKDEPSKDEPSKDEPSKDEPSKDEPSKDEPGTEAPSAGVPNAEVTTSQTPAQSTQQTQATESGTSGGNITVQETTEGVEETSETAKEKETTEKETSEEVTEVDFEETIAMETEENLFENDEKASKNNHLWIKILVCVLLFAVISGAGLIVWKKRRDL
ncbi:MAG: hypothetical protein PUB54_07595 [Lachnospiraceae bacterium]|nr:hypothetical protein [Lachnospiraceae bacterium]